MCQRGRSIFDLTSPSSVALSSSSPWAYLPPHSPLRLPQNVNTSCRLGGTLSKGYIEKWTYNIMTQCPLRRDHFKRKFSSEPIIDFQEISSCSGGYYFGRFIKTWGCLSQQSLPQSPILKCWATTVATSTSTSTTLVIHFSQKKCKTSSEESGPPELRPLKILTKLSEMCHF